MSFNPARTRLRLAAPSDADAMAQVFEAAWDAAYRDILPPSAFEELPQECSAGYWRLAVEAREPDRSIVIAVDEDDDALGLAAAGPDRFGSSGWAEIYSLYVMPGYQRQGLGRRLLCASFGTMRKAGYKSGIVWVLAEHVSRAFYEHMGGLGEYGRVSTEWGREVAQAGYVWDDLNVLLRQDGPCRARDNAAGRAP